MKRKPRTLGRQSKAGYGRKYHLLRYPHRYFPGGIYEEQKIMPTITVSGFDANDFIVIEYDNGLTLI